MQNKVLVPGDKFNRLEIIEEFGNNKYGQRLYIC